MPRRSCYCMFSPRRPTCSVISFPFWPITSMWSRPISQALASRMRRPRALPVSFENLTRVIDRFTQTLAVEGYAIYVFDYGAPVGLRLALTHPDRITAIVSQNGNAYEQGLSQGWNPIQKYWKEPTPENRSALREFLKPEATKSQYLYGVKMRPWSRRNPTNSMQRCSPGLAMTRSSLICLWITRAMSRSIPRFGNIFGASSHPCWRCGAILIHSFYPLVLKHSGAIIRAPRCVFTRHFALEPIIPKSLALFGISSIAS
jgi:pimeloyl-ACP methyl ester carboxylesterase